MWQRVLGKTSTTSIPDNAPSSSSKRKDSDARPRKRSDSTTNDNNKQPSTSSSARQAAASSRGDDRDRGFEPTSTSYSTTSQSAHRGTAAPSVASSYVTAQPGYDGRGGAEAPSPELVRNPSVRDGMPKSAASERVGTERLEELERKERRREKDGDRERKSERRRDRDDERERKGHRRDRSRSEERNGKKSSKRDKPKRRNTDGETEIVESPTDTRASERPRAGAADRFDAQISRPGFNQFPGSQDDSVLQQPRPARSPAFSPRVTDQFPGQFPSDESAPYRPPGLAADYYGDAGESVSQQPGVRPQAPDLIVGAEPHLMAASAVAAPPAEPSASGGVGASDTFFNSSHTFQTPEGSQTGSARVSPSGSPSRLPQSSSHHAPPAQRPPEFLGQHSATAVGGSISSQISPHTSGIVPTLGTAATGVAVGAAAGAAADYYMSGQSSSQHQHSQSISESVSGQYSSAVQHQYSPGPSTSGPSGAYDRPSGSYAQDARPSGSYSQDSRPPRPGKQPSSSSNVPIVAAAVGAAGLAAAAHHHHNNHNNSHDNHHSTSYQSTTGPGPGPGPYGGSTETPLAQHARPHRPRGPLGAIVDFFRDPDAVGRFEEYTEYIGVCRDCFEPGSSPRDAPRKHHRNRHLRKRRSGDRLGSSTRVDKTNRYHSSSSASSSDEGRGKKKGWLAGGIAGYGLAQVGKSLFGNNRDFDDADSVKTGRPAGASRESLSASGRRSPTRRGYVNTASRHGSDAQYAARYPYGVADDGYRTGARPGAGGSTVTAFVDRKASRDDRRERRESEFGVGDAAMGAALGAVAGGAVAAGRRREEPRREEVVVRREEDRRPEVVVRRERRGSHGSSSSDRRHRRRRSWDEAQAGGGIFGGFFTSPPPKDRRGGKKKAKGFFNFANGSSSSSDSALVVESSSGREKRKSSRLKNTKDANAALIGLGATAAALAAAEQRAGKKNRNGSRIIAEEIDKHRKHERDDHRRHHRGSDSSHEDGWESASDDDASVDSGLLFGSDASSRSSSSDRERHRRSDKRRHSRDHDSRLGTVAGVAAGAGAAAAGAAYLSREHDRPSVVAAPSGAALPPMRHVHPMATDDPGEFDVRPASEVSSVKPPLATSRPAPVPLQQPQPVTPVSMAVYATEGRAETGYGAPSGPPVFDPVMVRDDTPDHRARAERKDSRRADERVKFDFTREQQDRHDREERTERRKDGRVGKERDVVIDVDDPRRVEAQPRNEKDVIVEVGRSPRRHDSPGDEHARRARYEQEIFRLAQQEKPAEEPRLDERGAVIIEPSKAGLSKIEADEVVIDTPRSKERQKRYEARTRDEVEEKPARRDSAKSSGAFSGLVGAAVGAAAGVAIVEGSKSGKGKVYDEDRKDRWSGKDVDTRRDTSADDVSQERRLARQAAAKIRRTPTPVEHEDYGTFFESAVTDITSRPVGEKEKAGDPDADNAFVTVEPASPRNRQLAGPEVFPVELYTPFVDAGSRKFPWPVPMMGLVRPTPPPSRMGSYFNSPVVQPEKPKEIVEDIEITDVTDEPGAKSGATDVDPEVVEPTSVETPRKTSRVSFGANETREYETVSPLESKEDLRGARDIDRKGADGYTEPLASAKSVDSQSSVEEVKRTHIPSEFDEDPEIVATMAAGLQGSGFDPDIVMEDPKYFRRDSPPGSNEGSSFYQQPFYETTTDVNLGQRNRWDSPKEHGFVEGELPDTPKEVKREVMDEGAMTSSKEKKRSKRRSEDQSFAAAEQEKIEQGVRRAYTQDANAELDVIRAASRGPAEDSPDEDSLYDATKAREGLSKAAEAPITSKIKDVPLEGVKPTETRRERQRDVESLVEASLPQNDGKALASTSDRKKLDENEDEDEDVYESPQEYAASAADAAIGRSDSQSSKRKKKSKRKSSEYGDDRSVASAPVGAADRKDSDKKGKKGGILGLFGKSSDDSKEKQRSDAAEEDEREDTKRKHRKHRKSKEGDDFYSQPAMSTPDLAAYPEEESKKSKKSKDKEARRRSRHEDDERGEGRRTRERAEKMAEDEAAEAVLMREDDQRSESFLGERPEPTEPPDIRETEDQGGGGDLELRKPNRYSAPLPQTLPTTPFKLDQTKDDGYFPTDGSESPSAVESLGRRRSMIQTDVSRGGAMASPTAVPLVFRRPPSAGLPRSASASSTPISSPSLSTPKQRKSRPQSKEFKSNEFRPLFLVEQHNTKPEAESNEAYPSLPSSHTTSRASSVHEGDSGEYEVEGARAPFKGAPLDIEATKRADYLDSEQTTPTADTYKATREQKEQRFLDQARHEALSREIEWNGRRASEAQKRDSAGRTPMRESAEFFGEKAAALEQRALYDNTDALSPKHAGPVLPEQPHIPSMSTAGATSQPADLDAPRNIESEVQRQQQELAEAEEGRLSPAGEFGGAAAATAALAGAGIATAALSRHQSNDSRGGPPARDIPTVEPQAVRKEVKDGHLEAQELRDEAHRDNALDILENDERHERRRLKVRDENEPMLQDQAQDRGVLEEGVTQVNRTPDFIHAPESPEHKAMQDYLGIHAQQARSLDDVTRDVTAAAWASAAAAGESHAGTRRETTAEGASFAPEASRPQSPRSFDARQLPSETIRVNEPSAPVYEEPRAEEDFAEPETVEAAKSSKKKKKSKRKEAKARRESDIIANKGAPAERTELDRSYDVSHAAEVAPRAQDIVHPSGKDALAAQSYIPRESTIDENASTNLSTSGQERSLSTPGGFPGYDQLEEAVKQDASMDITHREADAPSTRSTGEVISGDVHEETAERQGHDLAVPAAILAAATGMAATTRVSQASRDASPFLHPEAIPLPDVEDLDLIESSKKRHSPLANPEAIPFPDVEDLDLRESSKAEILPMASREAPVGPERYDTRDFAAEEGTADHGVDIETVSAVQHPQEHIPAGQHFTAGPPVPPKVSLGNNDAPSRELHDDGDGLTLHRDEIQEQADTRSRGPEPTEGPPMPFGSFREEARADQEDLREPRLDEQQLLRKVDFGAPSLSEEREMAKDFSKPSSPAGMKYEGYSALATTEPPTFETGDKGAPVPEIYGPASPSPQSPHHKHGWDSNPEPISLPAHRDEDLEEYPQDVHERSDFLSQPLTTERYLTEQPGSDQALPSTKPGIFDLPEKERKAFDLPSIEWESDKEVEAARQPIAIADDTKTRPILPEGVLDAPGLSSATEISTTKLREQPPEDVAPPIPTKQAPEDQSEASDFSMLGHKPDLPTPAEEPQASGEDFFTLKPNKKGKKSPAVLEAEEEEPSLATGSLIPDRLEGPESVKTPETQEECSEVKTKKGKKSKKQRQAAERLDLSQDLTEEDASLEALSKMEGELPEMARPFEPRVERDEDGGKPLMKSEGLGAAPTRETALPPEETQSTTAAIPASEDLEDQEFISTKKKKKGKKAKASMAAAGAATAGAAAAFGADEFMDSQPEIQEPLEEPRDLGLEHSRLDSKSNKMDLETKVTPWQPEALKEAAESNLKLDESRDMSVDPFYLPADTLEATAPAHDATLSSREGLHEHPDPISARSRLQALETSELLSRQDDIPVPLIEPREDVLREASNLQLPGDQPEDFMDVDVPLHKPPSQIFPERDVHPDETRDLVQPDIEAFHPSKISSLGLQQEEAPREAPDPFKPKTSTPYHLEIDQPRDENLEPALEKEAPSQLLDAPITKSIDDDISTAAAFSQPPLEKPPTSVSTLPPIEFDDAVPEAPAPATDEPIAEPGFLARKPSKKDKKKAKKSKTQSIQETPLEYLPGPEQEEALDIGAVDKGLREEPENVISEAPVAITVEEQEAEVAIPSRMLSKKEKKAKKSKGDSFQETPLEGLPTFEHQPALDVGAIDEGLKEDLYGPTKTTPEIAVDDVEVEQDPLVRRLSKKDKKKAKKSKGQSIQETPLEELPGLESTRELDVGAVDEGLTGEFHEPHAAEGASSKAWIEGAGEFEPTSQETAGIFQLSKKDKKKAKKAKGRSVQDTPFEDVPETESRSLDTEAVDKRLAEDLEGTPTIPEVSNDIPFGGSIDRPETDARNIESSAAIPVEPFVHPPGRFGDYGPGEPLASTLEKVKASKPVVEDADVSKGIMDTASAEPTEATWTPPLSKKDKKKAKKQQTAFEADAVDSRGLENIGLGAVPPASSEALAAEAMFEEPETHGTHENGRGFPHKDEIERSAPSPNRERLEDDVNALMREKDKNIAEKRTSAWEPSSMDVDEPESSTAEVTMSNPREPLDMGGEVATLRQLDEGHIEENVEPLSKAASPDWDFLVGKKERRAEREAAVEASAATLAEPAKPAPEALLSDQTDDREKEGVKEERQSLERDEGVPREVTPLDRGQDQVPAQEPAEDDFVPFSSAKDKKKKKGKGKLSSIFEEAEKALPLAAAPVVSAKLAEDFAEGKRPLETGTSKDVSMPEAPPYLPAEPESSLPPPADAEEARPGPTLTTDILPVVVEESAERHPDATAEESATFDPLLSRKKSKKDKKKGKKSPAALADSGTATPLENVRSGPLTPEANLAEGPREGYFGEDHEHIPEQAEFEEDDWAQSGKRKKGKKNKQAIASATEMGAAEPPEDVFPIAEGAPSGLQAYEEGSRDLEEAAKDVEFEASTSKRSKKDKKKAQKAKALDSATNEPTEEQGTNLHQTNEFEAIPLPGPVIVEPFTEMPAESRQPEPTLATIEESASEESKSLDRESMRDRPPGAAEQLSTLQPHISPMAASSADDLHLTLSRPSLLQSEESLVSGGHVPGPDPAIAQPLNVEYGLLQSEPMDVDRQSAGLPRNASGAPASDRYDHDVSMRSDDGTIHADAEAPQHGSYSHQISEDFRQPQRLNEPVDRSVHFDEGVESPIETHDKRRSFTPSPTRAIHGEREGIPGDSRTFGEEDRGRAHDDDLHLRQAATLAGVGPTVLVPSHRPANDRIEEDLPTSEPLQFQARGPARSDLDRSDFVEEQESSAVKLRPGERSDSIAHAGSREHPVVERVEEPSLSGIPTSSHGHAVPLDPEPARSISPSRGEIEEFAPLSRKKSKKDKKKSKKAEAEADVRALEEEPAQGGTSLKAADSEIRPVAHFAQNDEPITATEDADVLASESRAPAAEEEFEPLGRKKSKKEKRKSKQARQVEKDPDVEMEDILEATPEQSQRDVEVGDLDPQSTRPAVLEGPLEPMPREQQGIGEQESEQAPSKKGKKGKKGRKEKQTSWAEEPSEPVSRSISLKDTTKTAGTVGTGVAIFEGLQRAASLSEPQDEHRRSREGSLEAPRDASQSTLAAGERELQRDYAEEPSAIGDRKRGRERSLSPRQRGPANRDSALHMPESPMPAEHTTHRASVRDSGYQGYDDSPFLAQESPRSPFDETTRRRPRHRSHSPRSPMDREHPLQVSVETDPDYDVSITSPRGIASQQEHGQEPGDLPRLPERAQDYPSPAKSHIEREPSPVDSMTKDRSAALFDSSPSIRDKPQPHDSRLTPDEPHTPASFAREQEDHARDISNAASGSLFGGPVGVNSDGEAMRSPPQTPMPYGSAGHPLTTIAEQSPEDSPLRKKSLEAAKAEKVEHGDLHRRRSRRGAKSPQADGARQAGLISTDDLISRLSWPDVDEESHSVDLERSRSRPADKDRRSSGPQSKKLSLVTDPARHDGERRSTSGASIKSNDSINAIIRSPRMHASETPPPHLRRASRSISSDLRAASRRDETSSVGSDAKRSKDAKPRKASLGDVDLDRGAAIASSSTYDPVNDKGKGRITRMTDVYEGWGDVSGSPRSPTRPPSMRRRQSLQILDMETRLDQLVSENRLLQEGKSRAERQLDEATHDHSQENHALSEAVATRDVYLKQKSDELDELRGTLQELHNEVSRLTEVNRGLSGEGDGGVSYEHRYRELEREHNTSRQQLKESSRELDELRTKHTSLSGGMEAIVANEVRNALRSKNAELEQLRGELDAAKEQVRILQQQILASRGNDEILVDRDPAYFDTRCQQLCQHVQQWVLRFSKFSDNRACRRLDDIADEKTFDRFDNALLDGSDADVYLQDRVRRRDVFMSVAMSMVHDFVFTRYLFGMDREQRQKLKALEKTVAEVGPPAAVDRWRATTLTLLAKREAFRRQREQDTEAVVHEIFGTLAAVLPPPSNLVGQIQDSLRKALSAAVDLSIEMRTQRAEYIMLPPLKPEYDVHGDLAHTARFDAELMNERSGATASNEELEAQGAAVRIVLFPLVVRQGASTEAGRDGERSVVCPAQVLVARDEPPPTGRRGGRAVSAMGNRSVGNVAQVEGGMI